MRHSPDARPAARARGAADTGRGAARPAARAALAPPGAQDDAGVAHAVDQVAALLGRAGRAHVHRGRHLETRNPWETAPMSSSEDWYCGWLRVSAAGPRPASPAGRRRCRSAAGPPGRWPARRRRRCRPGGPVPGVLRAEPREPVTKSARPSRSGCSTAGRSSTSYWPSASVVMTYVGAVLARHPVAEPQRGALAAVGGALEHEWPGRRGERPPRCRPRSRRRRPGRPVGSPHTCSGSVVSTAGSPDASL